jgi:hypothetical protein
VLIVGIWIASFLRVGHFCDAIKVGMNENQVDKLAWVYSKKALSLKDTLWAKSYTNMPTNGYVRQYWMWHLQPVEVIFTTNRTVEIALPTYE